MPITSLQTPADTGFQDIYSARLVSDTDGRLWELMLNFKNRYGCLFPLIESAPNDKLIALPDQQYVFKLPCDIERDS